MRILYIIHQFFPEFATGTERVTMNIARTQQRNGHSVDVLTCSVRGASYWCHEHHGLRHAVVDGIRIFAIPREALSASTELAAEASQQARSIISHFLDQNTYDVVHVMHSMRMADAIDVVRQREIPYVITLTDFFLLCFRINLRRLDGNYCDGPQGGNACRSHCIDVVASAERLRARRHRLSNIIMDAREVVACSEYVADVFRKEYPDLPIRVLGHGIDLPRHHFEMRKSAGNPVVFGYVGTLSEAKGVHVLMQAFNQAALNNACLEIIGSSYDDDGFAAELKKMRNLQIKMRGAIDHTFIPQALATFDVLCLPSLVPETFSLALHEGFAAGLPALVSDIGWPARVVAKASCGRIVSAGNIEAWQIALTELAKNPELINSWRDQIPLQIRTEEEGFFYDQLYRRAVFSFSAAI